MENLNLNRIIFCIAIILQIGCVSSSFYKITFKDDDQVELSVSPDRIVLECEKQLEDSDEIYGFMIHVLDDQNTVLNVYQSNNVGMEGCFDRYHKIGKIIQQGKQIHLAGMGDIDKPRKKGEYSHTFPGHGTFHTNERGLHFFNVMNEYGACYDAYYAQKPPCPHSGPFSVHKQK